MELRNCIKKFGELGEWVTAAKQFADYWGGAGSWHNMPAEARNAFVEALKPNYFEWDAVMNETTPAEQWRRLLPRSTLLASDPNTVFPIREITATCVDPALCGPKRRLPEAATWRRLRVQISSTRL
jgi:hypothetical protein